MSEPSSEPKARTDIYIDFVNALGLRPEKDDMFVGRVQGFPVGLKFIDPAGATVLLFQVRHWLKPDSAQITTLTYDSEITELLAGKRIEIEFEEQLAWVTFVDGAQSIENGTALRRLNSILQSFFNAGLIGDTELCHYCRHEKVALVTYGGGKVAQICPACLDERLKKAEGRSPAPGAEAVPIFLMSPGASLVGALAWSCFWIGHTLLFEHLSAERIYLPWILMIAIMIGIGLLVGGPVGWMIKQNRKRGGAVSFSAAIVFGSLAVIVGEIFYLVWLIYHEFHVVSFSAALQVMPQYYLKNDPIFVGTKLITALICVSVAVAIAKPEKAKLNL